MNVAVCSLRCIVFAPCLKVNRLEEVGGGMVKSAEISTVSPAAQPRGFYDYEWMREDPFEEQ